MKISAITSCATGIAHSYMAAEALEKAAKAAGDEIKVEIQGAMGIENELSQKDIDASDLIIWAVDVSVSKAERFAGKKIYEVSPHDAITDAQAMLEQAKQFAASQ